MVRWSHLLCRVPRSSRKLRTSCVVAPAWCVQCDSWQGSPHARGDRVLRTGQVVTLARLFQDHAHPRGCENGYLKQKPRWPDFRHKQQQQESGELPWAPGNWYKPPAWLGDAQTERMAPAPSLSAAAAADCGDQPVVVGQARYENHHRSATSPSSELVKNLCKQGQVKGAVEALEALALGGTTNCGGGAGGGGIDKHLLYHVLKACVARKDLTLGGQVRAIALKTGFGSDTFLCNHFIRMYAGHGKLRDAMDVFGGVAQPDAFTWSAVILAHTRQGHAERAVELYRTMRRRGGAAAAAGPRTKADTHVVVAALQACAAAGDLGFGKQLHCEINECGLESDVVVGGSLVNMYAKCGSLRDARAVFDGLGAKNVVTWTAMIAGYAKAEGTAQEALDLYRSAMANGGGEGGVGVALIPNAVTFVCLLQACANVGASALGTGRQLHAQIRERGGGLDRGVAVGGSLVNMYAKCGSVEDARAVFDGLSEKNVVTWNAMIAGYARVEGMGQDALDLYSAMMMQQQQHKEGGSAGVVRPDAVTFVCLLQACANLAVSSSGSDSAAAAAGALEMGRRLHSQIKERGLDRDVAVSNSLVTMYAKCGSLADARSVFNAAPSKDVVTWTAMIAGYAKAAGMGQEALELYRSAMTMQQQQHSNNGGGGGEGVAAAVVVPNAVTFVCLLQACANVGAAALGVGKQLHSQIKERGGGLERDVAVGGSLVNMYAKCGSVADARAVFDGLQEKSVVTWTAMIAGYAQQQQQLQEGGGAGNNTAVMMATGQQEALALYRAMRRQAGTVAAVVPDAVTYACLLDACASVGAVQQGRELHAELRERGLESDARVGTCLVRMHGQHGRLDDARGVLDRMVPAVKSVEAWTALIKAYADAGDGGAAVRCFEEMVEAHGVPPTEVTYTCLLTACSLAGMVDAGGRYFCSMRERHGLVPGARHYTCVVDMLARAGHLDAAEQVAHASGLADSAAAAGGATTAVWTALLSACKRYGDAGLGRRCFDRLVSLDPAAATAYVLLAGIHACAGRWGDAERVERLRRAAGAGKKPARACIEVDRQVREFRVGDVEAEGAEQAEAVRAMSRRAKEEGGHVPQTQVVMRLAAAARGGARGGARAWCERDREQEEEEEALCGHAEKLALAYGLCRTPAGSTLVVTKNLRMCDDCHSSTKVVSRLEGREIVVRDCSKLHRFRNGACSCGDRP